jgi:CubicO group peptidase (beta-lactamase class C family)
MGTRVSRNLLPLGSGGCQSKNDKIQFRLNVWKPIRIALRVPDMASLLACVCPVVLSLVAVIATCSEAQQKAPASSLPRGIVWNHASTKDSQVDRAALDALYSDTEKEQHYDLKGIVIVCNGALVSERYFNGDSSTTLHDIRSATKSVTSLLMGIAIDEKIIHSVDDPISLHLPGLPKDGKEEIEIKDLLNMRSGLDADDEDPSTPGNEDRLDESSDWMRSVYAVPVKRTPGERYLYCSVNAFLTGAIIENAARTTLDDFASTHLFRPLNIQTFHWRHVPVNRTTGQGNLEITARDGAALGQLMLNDGVVDGRRIISHDWVTKSLASQVPISDSDPYADFLRVHVVHQSRAHRRPQGYGSLRIRQRRQQNLHCAFAPHGCRHYFERIRFQMGSTAISGHSLQNTGSYEGLNSCLLRSEAVLDPLNWSHHSAPCLQSKVL